MDAVVRQVQINARKVVMLQSSIALVAAVICAIMWGVEHGVAALFGGCISVVTSLLLRRGVVKASEIAAEDPKRGMTALYIGAVQRFVLILVLFGAGLGLIGLPALATVIGFGATQLAYAVVMKLSAKPGRR